jgi:hypothetical protein
MSAIEGTWMLTMRTPVGSIHAEMTFTSDGGVLSGSAVGKSETVVLSRISTQGVPEGERVLWSQSITKPMRLNLDFDVVVNGDELNGFSRAGRLPRSEVVGRRTSR